MQALALIARASAFRGVGETPLGMGAVVRLNSGGPECVVVDVFGQQVTVAWRDACGDVHEMEALEQCFHRVALGTCAA